MGGSGQTGAILALAQHQEETRRVGWMQTFSGRKIYIDDPDPTLIELEDIAHHLGMLVRFTGAVRRFYSIAEHSILVSYLCPRHLALVGLFHDAPEAYLADLNRPTKRLCPDYKALEKKWAKVMSTRLGFDIADMPPEIKEADTMALYLETQDLLSSNLASEWASVIPIEIRRDAIQIAGNRPLIRALPPEQAKMAFIERCLELTEKRR